MQMDRRTGGKERAAGRSRDGCTGQGRLRAGQGWGPASRSPQQAGAGGRARCHGDGTRRG